MIINMKKKTDFASQVQILDETVYISLHAKAFGKGKNLSLLFSATVNWREDWNFKPVVLCLKIDLMPHSDFGERGWINTYGERTAMNKYK